MFHTASAALAGFVEQMSLTKTGGLALVALCRCERAGAAQVRRRVVEAPRRSKGSGQHSQ